MKIFKWIIGLFLLVCILGFAAVINQFFGIEGLVILIGITSHSLIYMQHRQIKRLKNDLYEKGN